jgi:hypothetical protein
MKRNRLLLVAFVAIALMFSANLDTVQAEEAIEHNSVEFVESADAVSGMITPDPVNRDQDPPKKGSKKSKESKECETKASETKCCGETKAKSSECESGEKTKKKVG